MLPHRNALSLACLGLIAGLSMLTALLPRTAGAIEGVELTWRKAVILLPGRATKTGALLQFQGMETDTETWAADVAKTHLNGKIKVPALVYLHGCSGGYGEFHGWTNTFGALGLAVFAPNSFARPGREVMCDSGMKEGFRLKMRTDEARHARREIRKVPWVDQDRVILMGFSEGGFSVAEYAWNDYTAYIPTGTDCRVQGGGTYIPSGKPVLNIVGSKDHYGYGKGCDIWTKDDGSRSVVVLGAGHNVSEEPQAQQALLAFMEACCGIKPPTVEFDHETAMNDMIAEFGELAPVFAFQKSEDAMNAGKLPLNKHWLKVRDMIYEKLGLEPGH